MMTKRLWLSQLGIGAFIACVLAWSGSPVICFAGGEASSWTLEQPISLEGVKGEFDHFALDASKRRLFLAASENGTVEVIDLASGKKSQAIAGLKEPHGVLYIPDTKELVVTSGGDGKCIFYDESLKPVATIDGMPDADNLRYDAKTKRVFVAYGEGAIAVIDATTHKKVGEIALQKHPEAFLLESNGPRIFVDVPDTQDVVVLDREKLSVIGKWPIKAQQNFPLAADEAGHRLFVVCRKPAKLFVLDTESGKTITSVNCAGDADDVWFDAASKRIYVSGGEGHISVFESTGTDTYKEVAKVPTFKGAKTSFFVPETRTFYVAVPPHGKKAARVDVYKIATKP
ncbi:MAG: YncE family protein [Planctomycetes bacterium]|nr:YncE family protein [Planctomycetota bacterium]MBI3834378.1 YncE family protein [Planctomycetota bacterium]